jgi:hypothetical protein
VKQNGGEISSDTANTLVQLGKTTDGNESTFRGT